MTLRSNGSYIGPRPAGPSTSAASGIWDLRTAERQMRAATWPMPFGGPSSISGLELWLDASDSSTLYDATTGGSLVASDGSVARWEDKSGNSRHLTQSSSGNRPQRKTSIQNGKDIVRFDGTDDELIRSSFNLSSATAATLVFVMKYRSSAGFLITGGFGTNSSFAGMIMEKNRSTSRFSFVVGSSSLSSDASFGNTAPDTNCNVLTIVYGSGAATSYINNVEDASTSFAGPLNSSSGFCLGGYFGLAGYFSDADICEVAFYDTAITATDRSNLQSYFQTKWATA